MAACISMRSTPRTLTLSVRLLCVVIISWLRSIQTIRHWMCTKSTSTAAGRFQSGKQETPQEIKDELREEPKPGWVHWFFSFVHNLGLPKEKLDKILANTPKGTKIWKNKILGLRGKATGLVFPNFDRKKHVVTAAWVRSEVEAGRIQLEEVYLRNGYGLFQ